MSINEPFIVADAQDFHNYLKHRKAITDESDKFDDHIKVQPRTYIYGGYNYQDYINSAKPDEIDARILSQSGRGLPFSQLLPNIPVPSNYVL